MSEHALELLARHPRDTADAVHLDIGRRLAPIAERLQERLRVQYVGCPSHALDAPDAETIYRALDRIVAGRSMASLSVLGALEHLARPAPVLHALRRLAREHAAAIVLSAPNAARRDVGVRLAFGLRDDAGATSGFFSDASLRQMLARCGLHIVDENDVAHDRGCDAPDHPALAEATILNRLLTVLRDEIDRFADIDQFVRLCLPGPVEAGAAPATEQDAHRPFLSIVTRTQGTRLHALVEVFTCLAGQTNTDFEVLVLGHRLDRHRQAAVERVIEDNPAWLRNKVRLLRVDTGNRTRPLNAGFAAARGCYIAVLDDDDLPFANWVETFGELARSAPGRLLRSLPVRQEVRNVHVLGQPAIRAEGKLDKNYPPSFDLFEHLRLNQSPPVCVAFPRGVFHDLKITFDEELTTTEDWDYILRVASLVGAESSPRVTSLYRWWVSDESSRTQHDSEEWDRNYIRILNRLDRSPLVLFPPGTTGRIRFLLDAYELGSGKSLGIEWSYAPEARIRLAALREVLDICASTSWRVTVPVRFIGRLVGRPPFDRDVVWRLSADGLRKLAREMRASTSWRISAPIRALRQGRR